MAVVPISGSNVFFKKGVPFSNDYKNTRWFENAGDQFNYFSGRPTVHAMGEVTFVENDGKSYVSADASIDELRDTSYMMFQNANYSNKWFYAFVTKLTRKSSNTTYVYFEIDVLQTWLFNIEWKPSFVVREHCSLWNADGSPVVNTIDEGLNYGSEYETVYSGNLKLNKGVRFLVIAVKKSVHGTNKGNVMPSQVGVGQPFSYYIVPFSDSDTVVWATIQGKDYRMSTLIDTLGGLYKDQDFTNNIATMFITENVGLKTLTVQTEDKTTISFTDEKQILEYAEGGEGAKMIYVSDVKNFTFTEINIDDKYDGYRSVKESKLLMYPYTVLTLDDMQGNRIDYKNEYINSKDIDIIAKGSLGTSNRVMYAVKNYNISSDNSMRDVLADEHGIQNINPNDVSILTDMISAFLQGNKNSLLNQKDQIMLQGYAGMAQNTLGVAGSTMQGGAGGIIGGASSGISVIKGAGSTVLALQGIEAKIDDIRNLPPQLNKMGTNTSYDIGNGFKGVFLIKKQIKAEYQRKLEDFFNMFGYKKNEVKIPNFHTRRNWNYVETKSCNIVGDFNTEDLNELKAVFDRGITLWHTNDIGNYALSNEVI